MAQEARQDKKYELVHASRSRRERTVKCEATDCKNRVKRGQELCTSCQEKEDAYQRSFALR